MQGMPINITKECSDAEIFECDIATLKYFSITTFFRNVDGHALHSLAPTLFQTL